MSDRPKNGIELSSVQLVSSMAAAVTGAVLTSYLGDGGTILGTAVGSGASTAGFAVYKHYLSRTKEKVAPVLVEHARQWTPTGTMTGDQHSGSRADATRADATRADVTRAAATRADRPVAGGNGTSRGYTAADWEQARRTAPGWAQPTQAERGLDPGVTRQDFVRPRFVPHQAAGSDADATRTVRHDNPARYGTVRMGDGAMVNGSAGGQGGSRPVGPGSGGGAGEGRHGKPGGGFLANRPGWLIPAATAAVVFVVALIVITVVELGTGKPIGASVWGRSQTGTTIGGSHGKAAATPATSATPTQSSTPGTGATGSGQPTGIGTSGPTTAPTPTPSSVPTVGSTGGATVPASSAPGGRNGGGNGAAGTASVAPGQ